MKTMGCQERMNGNKTFGKCTVRGLVTMLLLVLVFTCMASGNAMAASKKKGKKKTSKKDAVVKVAVVDCNSSTAAGAIRWARRCGMSANQVESTKVDPAKYDGLIVPGGGDVTPSLYHAKKQRQTHGSSKKRDLLQINVIRKFAKAGKPIIGLCGGEQHINVAFGGTLKQHIGYHTGFRTVKISKSSFLYGTLGGSEAVYHFHHQCIKKVADGFVVTQRDNSDGEIEAIEHESLPIYGLQWHPESSGSAGLKVGQKFRSICLKYRK